MKPGDVVPLKHAPNEVCGERSCALCNARGFSSISKTILDKASDAVYGDRERDYGSALPDMARTAAMWSAILGTKVEPEQVPMCMVALKISRLVHAYKEDSIVDIAGWAAVLEKVVRERAGK